MKRLGRDAAELTALAAHLTAHGLVLEMLAGQAYPEAVEAAHADFAALQQLDRSPK